MHNNRWVHLFRYLITGSLTTLLDWMVFWACFYVMGFSQGGSVVIAFILALWFSFVVNRIWTFHSITKKQEWQISQFLKFTFVSLVGLLLSLFVMAVLTSLLRIEPLWAKLLTSGIVLFWNFTVHSFWTFTSDPATERVKPLFPEKKNFLFELTLVIPAFNESLRLPQTLHSALDYFGTKGISFQIIVVDDGSTDNTAILAQEILSAPHKVIVLSKNEGKGYAIKTGVEEAQGRYILFCDADKATPFSEYEKLREKMLYAHVAIGSRYTNQTSVQKKQPWYRVFFSRVMNIVAQVFLIEGVKDTQCGFKLFRNDIGKKAFSVQKIKRFAFDIEFLMVAKHQGSIISEVSVLWYDQDGSTFSSIKDGATVLRDFFRIKFYMMFGFYS